MRIIKFVKRIIWTAIEIIGAIFWLIGTWLFSGALLFGIGMDSLSGENNGKLSLILFAGGIIGLVPLALLISIRNKRDMQLAGVLRVFLLLVLIAAPLLLLDISDDSRFGQVVDIGKFSQISGTVTHSNTVNIGQPDQVEGYLFFQDPLESVEVKAYRFHDFTNQDLAPGKNLMFYVRDGDQINKNFWSTSLTLTRKKAVSRWNYVPQPPAKE